MARSAIRGAGIRLAKDPDFASLHPGYKSAISLLLRPRLRPVIGDAADHGGRAELLAQAVHGALGVGGAAVEHVGVVVDRAFAQRADAGAHQPESGAVDLLGQHLAADRKDLRGELAGTTVTLKLKTADFRQRTRSQSITAPTPQDFLQRGEIADVA